MKGIIISTLIGIAIIGGSLAYTRGGFQNNDLGTVDTDIAYVNNVSVVDGKQIIEIRAKGGYQPRQSIAKAGIPTILRFDTNGTFDCSSSVRIPSLDISKVLPPSGVTDIDVGVQQIAKLDGTCGMGMYPFEIDFI